MMFGLDESELALIVSVFRKYPSVVEARVFGSRALGEYKSYSDVDIALFGSIKPVILGRIQLDLDDLPLPYIFDIKNYSSIKHTPLKQHIDIYGKSLYEIASSRVQ